jgi:hypothetical protein
MKKFLNDVVSFGIILLVGSTIQKEIIKQCPELEQEIRRSYRRMLVVAVLIAILVSILIIKLAGS